MFENGRHPEAIMMVPGVFELDTGHKQAAAHSPLAQHRRPTPATGRPTGLQSFSSDPTFVPLGDTYDPVQFHSLG
jgi:hypothetical protein